MEGFRFRPDASAGSALYLTDTALAALGSLRPGRVVAVHGTNRLQVDLVRLPETGTDLPVAPSLQAALGLMPEVPYRLRFSQGELRIGPVIGILVARRLTEIDADPGSLMRHFLLRYPAVGGLVYLCGAEEIDPSLDYVQGLCWVPDPEAEPAHIGDMWRYAERLAARVSERARAEAIAATPHPRIERFRLMAQTFLDQTPVPDAAPVLDRGRFVAGRFPLPGALWRRTGYLADDRLNFLARRMGARFFNAHFFDKEQGYRLLAQDPAVAPHLPHTEVYRGAEQLLERLAAQGAVVLKQQDGNSGYGMMLLSQEGEGYRLRYREATRGEERFADAEALSARLATLVEGSPYLLQQRVELPAYQGRLSDYRVMMQKDDRGRWVARAIIGRFGAPGAVVTNFINQGYALPADEALRRAFGVGFREAYAMKSELVDFALTVCRALDNSGGCYGDLGLDVGIDTQRRFWLFEVNKLPFHELPLFAGAEQTYLDVKSGPLLYAAYLAGFGRHG